MPNRYFTIPNLDINDRIRFWTRVRIGEDHECWEWQRSVMPGGYGTFGLKGKGNYRAHRVAYFIRYGIQPGELYVCHKCDNPLCCNPDHLFLGTPKDNVQDMMKKGRGLTGDKNPSRMHPERLARGLRSGMHTHPEKRSYGDKSWTRKYPEKLRRGEQHQNTKLKNNDVIDIRRKHAEGIPSRQLAKEYHIGKSTVLRIVRREVWGHI